MGIGDVRRLTRAIRDEIERRGGVPESREANRLRLAGMLYRDVGGEKAPAFKRFAKAPADPGSLVELVIDEELFNPEGIPDGLMPFEPDPRNLPSIGIPMPGQCIRIPDEDYRYSPEGNPHAGSSSGRLEVGPDDGSDRIRVPPVRQPPILIDGRPVATLAEAAALAAPAEGFYLAKLADECGPVALRTTGGRVECRGFAETVWQPAANP